jgi:thioredoxin
MAEPILLTDVTLSEKLSGSLPVLLLVTTGNGLRSDFATAFKQAAAQHNDIIFGRLNPAENPDAAARFGSAVKPVLIGLAGGKEVVRRFRPWGTDVEPLIAELRAKSATGANGNIAHEITHDMQDSHQEEQHMDMIQATPSNAVQAADAPVKVTDATFQAEVIDYHLPVLVDFWAEWCGPCRQIGPALERLAKEFAGQVRIAKVNVDENPGLSQTFRIMSIPNLMMIKNRTMVFNQPGALPEPVMRDLITKLIALEVPDPSEGEAQDETEGQPAS